MTWELSQHFSFDRRTTLVSGLPPQAPPRNPKNPPALLMSFHINVPELPPSDDTQPQEEEFYSSWSLFLVCSLLILSLLTSYFLKVKKIKTVHETLVSIAAGMAVGLVVRIAPGTMIEHMLVS
jgi:hypothetical protein